MLFRSTTANAEMKRVTIFLLLFCYLIPAVGLSVVVHYCSGKLASVSLLLTDNSACSCGKMPMKKSCCKNKVTAFKIRDAHQLSKQLSLSSNKIFKFQPQYSVSAAFNIPSTVFVKNILSDHPPFLQKKLPLHLLYQVFII